MEFLKLPIDEAIPPGYSLTTVTKAEAQLPKILHEIFFQPGERVRLKNGCLYAGKVVRKYRTDTKFKLVGLSASSKSDDVEEELTAEDVLIALAYAGCHDDVEEVKELVSGKGAHILSQEVASANFCTVVHVCAESGSIRTLATLFEQHSESIRPEAVDGDGDNALHDLAPCPKNGQEAARIILRSPHAANMLRSLNQLGRTPLHDAILYSNESVCKGLLDTQTATPEIDWLEVALKTSHEDTALHLAVKRGYIDVVDGILAYPGAEARNLANKVNRRGETPLHLASSLGHEVICSELLKYGASIQMKDRAGRSPVTNAFRRRHRKVVQTLLEFCLDKTTLINEKFEFGLTLLHIAAATSSDTHVFSSLLKAGAFGDARSDDGKTPLHVATEKPNWIAFKCLLRPDIKFSDKMSHEQWVNMQDFSGQTALHNAVRCTRHLDKIDILSEAVATLCKKGALVDLKNRHGETPLHIAAREGQPEVVEYLLSNYEHCSHSQGTDRDTWMIMCDFSGETALHEAARSSRKDIVERLLRETQNLNYLLQVRDIETRTALHWAVQKNDEEIVKAMLTRADPKTKLFLLWNVIGTAAQVPEVLKKHVEQATGDVQTNLLQIAADVEDLDMARELINRGAEITTLQKNSHLWLSKNLCRKASDRPALDDSLGRRRLVHGIAALLLNPYTGTPITIGVFGEWGTGKSSFMLQVEATLLQMAVKEIFKKTLPSDKSDQELLGRIIPETNFSSTGEKLRSQVDKALRKCMSQTEFEINEGDDFIDNFPIKSQSECRHLFKELALTDRSNLVQSSDGQVRHNAMTTDQSLKEALATGHIPAVLTVRYNAWQYENKVEASAGLAVEITQEIEGSMTPPQWLRMCCKYSWKEQPKDIFVQLLLPIFLAFIAASIVLVLWKVAPIKIEYKLLSLPVGVLGVIWVFFRTLLQVVQPVTHAIQKYIRSPDHKSMLGYQQRVIDDIGFLIEQLCVEADQVWWRIFGFLGWFFITNSYNMKDTHVRKQHPQLNNLRIVVFIDDLDRCQEKTILELLSAINLILGICGINVVLGIDKGMVERAITTEFLKGTNFQNVAGDKVKNDLNKEDVLKPNNPDANDLADKYLRKIIQLPVQMPDPSGEDLKIFLKGQIGHVTQNRQPHQEKQEDQRNKKEDMQTDKQEHLLHTCSQDNIHVEIREEKIPIAWENPRKQVSSTEGAFRLLLANYSPMETEMLLSLCDQTMGDHRFPREWKRFLNYHRLAWSILSQDSKMEKENFKGWQRKLMLWIFVCWNWREQMDVIIEDWQDLLSERQKAKEEESSDWRKVRSDEEDESSDEEDESSDEEYESNDEENQHINEGLLSLGDVIGVHMEKKGWKKKQEIQSIRPPKQGSNDQGDVGIQRKWIALYNTLKKEYDIRMDFIEMFQQFRFYCKLDHLQTNPMYMKMKREKRTFLTQPLCHQQDELI